MRTKFILSSLILLAFTILGSGSFDGEDFTGFWVALFVIAVFLIIITMQSIKDGGEKEEQARVKREERLKAQTEKYETLKQNFITTNGTPDKTLVINKLDFNSEIHVFESSKRVFILGKEYAFQNIISCSFSDSPRVIRGKISAVTKSKNGSVIGRALIGDVIAGPTGAIIGGTTAPKNTDFIQGNDKIIHDYTVVINMNSIAEPIISIHTGEDSTLTHEIVGLMNVIISRNEIH